MPKDQLAALAQEHMELLARQSHEKQWQIAIASLVLYSLCKEAENRGLGKADELMRGQVAHFLEKTVPKHAPTADPKRKH